MSGWRYQTRLKMIFIHSQTGLLSWRIILLARHVVAFLIRSAINACPDRSERFKQA